MQICPLQKPGVRHVSKENCGCWQWTHLIWLIFEFNKWTHLNGWEEVWDPVVRMTHVLRESRLRLSFFYVKKAVLKPSIFMLMYPRSVTESWGVCLRPRSVEGDSETNLRKRSVSDVGSREVPCWIWPEMTCVKKINSARCPNIYGYWNRRLCASLCSHWHLKPEGSNSPLPDTTRQLPRTEQRINTPMLSNQYTYPEKSFTRSMIINDHLITCDSWLPTRTDMRVLTRIVQSGKYT